VCVCVCVCVTRKYLQQDFCKISLVQAKLSLALTEHYALKAYWGSGGINLRVLDLASRWRSVVSFTTRKQPLVPIG
jgi:hypothetical protein